MISVLEGVIANRGYDHGLTFACVQFIRDVAMITDLWPRVRDFSFGDSDSELPFSKRLARENGWTLEYAEQVILEYKRFIYLGVTCSHPVTPSDAVDQAWHLHLSYTRSYWEDLCEEVLGQKFHHGPTKGGASENQKFLTWYETTLVSYVKCFECEPPAEIWPRAMERFRFGEFCRVDRSRYWVLPKPHLSIGGMICLSIIPAGCVFAASSQSQEFPLGIVVLLILLIVGLSALSKLGTSRKKRKRRDNGGCGTGGGCSSSHDSGCGSSCGGGCGGGGD